MNGHIYDCINIISKGCYDHLDEKENSVREGSDASHLYNPENVWWD